MPPDHEQFDAYLSHPHSARDFALRLKEALQGRGLRIWMADEQVRLGDSIPERLAEGLANSRTVVAVITADTEKSTWARREIEAAIERHASTGRGRVILVVAEPVELPSDLARYRYLDMSRRRPDEFDAAVEQLVEVIKSEPADMGERDRESEVARLQARLSLALQGFAAVHDPARAPAVYAGRAEVVASGTVITLDGAPVTIRLGWRAPVSVRFEFLPGPEGTGPTMGAVRAEGDTLVLELRNFNNPLGDGTVRALKVASTEGHEVLLHFRVWRLTGSEDRTLAYSFYLRDMRRAT